MYSLKDLLGFKVQFLWWGRLPKLKVYSFPQDRGTMPFLFLGLYLGIIEFRLFNDHYTRFI